MLVHELMTRQVHSVRPDDGVQDALQLLVTQWVTSVPVVADDGAVVGIVSEADLLGVLVGRDPRAHLIPTPTRNEPPRTVRDIMTAHPHLTRGGEDVDDLAKVMAEHGWKSVPVVDDDGHLVAMISRSDIIRALARPDADARLDLLRALAGFGHASWQVSVVHGRACVTGPTTVAERAVANAAAMATTGIRSVAPPER